MPTIRDAYDRWSHQYDEQENETRDLDAALLPRLALERAQAWGEEPGRPPRLLTLHAVKSAG